MNVKRLIACASVFALLCLTACGAKPEQAPKPRTDPAMPTEKAQIIAFYNDAVNRAVEQALPFAKDFACSDGRFNLSPALSPFESEARDLTNVGRKRAFEVTPQTLAKEPYDKFLQRACLTDEDVAKAVCTCNPNGSYRIALYIQDGESHVAPGRNVYASSLDRCGIAVADAAGTERDRKTAQTIYEQARAVSQNVRIDEAHTNIVLVAVVTPDGTPVQINVRFDVRYSVKDVCGVGFRAGGVTRIKSDFRVKETETTASQTL